MKFAILRVTTMLAVVMALAALSAQAQTVLNKEKFTKRLAAYRILIRVILFMVK